MPEFRWISMPYPLLQDAAIGARREWAITVAASLRCHTLPALPVLRATPRLRDDCPGRRRGKAWAFSAAAYEYWKHFTPLFVREIISFHAS